MSTNTLIELTENGLYCAPGDFYVDPLRPVARAVVTHAHADHVCWGCGCYLSSHEGGHILRARLGYDAPLETLPYGEATYFNGVRVSLHPSGHIRGAVQVRIEHRGEVWVISGDYKLDSDPTCTPFEPVRCHTFVTESTFGRPVYRWPRQSGVFKAINAWWRANQEAGKASLLLGYALGKAQRLLMGIDPTIGPVYTHGTVEKINRTYRESGVPLPNTTYVGDADGADWSRALIIAPPSVVGTPWTDKFGAFSTGFASGWMRTRSRRRREFDCGFVLSDHADWPGLLKAITATGAERVWISHGYAPVLVRWLEDEGYESYVIPTRFEGAQGEEVWNVEEIA
jgi:putative mRNA 3-end processing factor